ncbi:MAG: hypothetical protein ACTS1X_09380 [Parasphingopyxis sp.]|uniref:hypothetical protein n=1 Tax=Parasphingopyxis sp. TaxID=1920299 RepID=UPI003F9F85F4
MNKVIVAAAAAGAVLALGGCQAPQAGASEEAAAETPEAAESAAAESADPALHAGEASQVAEDRDNTAALAEMSGASPIETGDEEAPPAE